MSKNKNLHDEKKGITSAMMKERSQLRNRTKPQDSQPLNVCSVTCFESLNMRKKMNRPVTEA